MKRYLVAALACGAVYALCGPIFVHFVLDEGLQQELGGVVARVLGGAPAPVEATVDAAGGTDWGQLALHLLVRVMLGFLTVALFAALQRRRSRLRAARITGAVCWLLAYVAWPLCLFFAFGLSTLLLFVAIGYGLVETQAAAHVGALAYGRPGSKP